MANRKFSSEELAELRHNPFVKNATENKLSFTTEFKESFWKRAKAGEPLAEIVRAFGLKPEVLGERRIMGIYVSCPPNSSPLEVTKNRCSNAF